MITVHPVIAIDGPAASGKSSVARRIAQQLGWHYLNTGNMYRAVTWAVLDRGIALEDSAAITALGTSLGMSFVANEDQHIVTHVEDTALTDAQLNNEAVNGAVSFVARLPEVRTRLVAEQRLLSALGPIVMEGRDIGSVVFPETPLKLYIDASEEVRYQRRQSQGLTDAVSLRDKMDSTRTTSPLIIPDGAARIDSSEMALEEVVTAAMAALKEQGIATT
jgi:cytidylate kinase